MNELFGMLIPLLMSGQGLGDVLRSLGGPGRGAAGYDGLNSMMSTSMAMARFAFPPTQSSGQVSGAIENALSKLGINPYSSGGQGASAFLSGIYHLAPGFMGGMLGIQDPRQFYSMIANGASGISAASGYGATDLFNPYSVMASQKRTMDLARVAYNLGTRPEGGYNLAFSHGLNMEEMGLVSQRLLSSGMAYHDEKGNMIDPNKQADAFSKNLERLGSKFNEAASMLSKVTGSVEEALNVMDRMAGGNFLGGTESQASAIANKAKNMATAIRVTSAIAGTDPRQAFRQMNGLMSAIPGAMGIDPNVANASGFSGMMGDLAFSATMGYNSWAAMNPNASVAQKQSAMFAVNSRVMQYAKNNGQAFASLIADNADKFSPEGLKRVVEALRRGRPNDVAGYVRSVVGDSLYDAHMNDPALQAAARQRAFMENPDQMNLLDSASLAGGLEQAEVQGTRRMVGLYMRDLDRRIQQTTGDSRSRKEREDMVKKAMSGTIQKVLGLTEEDTKDWNMFRVREALKTAGGYDEQEEQRAMLEAARKQVIERTMSDEEDEAARNALAERIGTGRNEKEREWLERLKEKGSLDSVFREYSSSMKVSERRAAKKDIFGRKLSQEQARSELSNIERTQNQVNGVFTDDERINEIDRRVKEDRLNNTGGLATLIASADMKNMGAAMDDFAGAAKALADKGEIVLGDGKDLSGEYLEAAKRMVRGAIGSSLGEIEGDDLEKLIASVASDFVSNMKEGGTTEEAFKKALAKKKQDGFKGIGDKEKSGIDSIVGNVDDKKTSVGKAVSGESFFATAKSVIDENQVRKGRDSIARMRELAAGNFGDLSAKDAFAKFIGLAQETGQIDVSPEELERIREEGVNAIGGKEDAQKQISAALAKIMPNGLKGGKFASFAGRSPNAALELAAAMQYKAAGGKVTGGFFRQEVVDMVSALDNDAANSMNAVSNAWGVGGNSYAKGAIAGVEKQMDELSRVLKDNGITQEDLKKYYGGDEDAKGKIEKALQSRATSKSDAALLKTIGGGAKIGGKDAIDILYSGPKGELERKKKDGEEAYNKDMLDIARKTGRNENEYYEMIHGVSDFMGKIAPFFKDPGWGINVHVTNS